MASDENRRVEMNMSRAVAMAAAADETELRRAYGAGVARGATNTQCTAEEERTYGTLRLLTLATLRLPDLFLYAHIVEVLAGDRDGDRLPPVAVRAIITTAAGALRLAHRALETHAREVGYETGAWIDGALEHTVALLSSQVDAEAPVLVDHARLAAIALTRATAATADDRMLVPDEVATGLAHLLAVYLVATAIG
jgi:hypothetical protein